jgi:hypothetical protein
MMDRDHLSRDDTIGQLFLPLSRLVLSAAAVARDGVDATIISTLRSTGLGVCVVCPRPHFCCAACVD